MSRKGYAIVTDLNKCLGCQACALECKIWWASKQHGLHNAWWIIAETRPGTGYPRNWVENVKTGTPPAKKNYEPEFEFRYNALIDSSQNGFPRITPDPMPKYGPNWDFDTGVGDTPDNAWYFYLPIQCMHCDDAPCVDVCPSHAMYKTDKGMVIHDPTVCIGCKSCFNACPYRRIFWNDELNQPAKCIMCEPFVEKGDAPVCVRACGGKARFFGELDDPASPVHVFVEEYKVAIPLFPQYKTNPRVLYIPPVLNPPADGKERYDKAYLEEFFGKNVWKVKEILEAERKKKDSKLIRYLGGSYS